MYAPVLVRELLNSKWCNKRTIRGTGTKLVLIFIKLFRAFPETGDMELSGCCRAGARADEVE